MELIPAIDILRGKVVRLAQGDFSKVSQYGDDPIAQAQSFCEQGAKRIHVVDLDGAQSGKATNRAIIESLIKRVRVDVQLGGGIRHPDHVKGWLEAGVSRVVIGTMAVKEPETCKKLSAEHPGKIIVALDVRGKHVVSHGWDVTEAHEVFEMARMVDAWQPAGILCTDVSRDGMEQGPNIDLILGLQKEAVCDVIASGGIASIADIVELAKCGVRSAVCGRALYRGTFQLREAFEALKKLPC